MEIQMIKGGCLCGQVSYTADGEAALVGVCHCKHCQKQSGTAFGLVIGVPKAAFSLKGDAKIYHDQGDSGERVDRAFCPNCGSLLTTDAAVMPDLIFIKAGSLDDTSWVQPTIQMFCDNAQPWVHLSGLQSFAKMPG
jgi:hypothetical protein